MPYPPSRTRPRVAAGLLAAALVAAIVRPARADEVLPSAAEGAPLVTTRSGTVDPQAPPPVPAAVPARPGWQREGTWGWFLVVTSLIAGAAVTTYGLTIDCERDDIPCARGSGLAIVGGVGIASAGSLAGITIVQAGQRGSAGLQIGSRF
jgi:hypothetical protein